MKTTLKIAMLAALLSMANIANAQVHWGFGIYVGTPPPPPPPRREFVCENPYVDGYWTAGYWNFDRPHRRYAWVPGRWNRPMFRREFREERREHWMADRREEHRDRRDDHGEHRRWDRHEDQGRHHDRDWSGLQGDEAKAAFGLLWFLATSELEGFVEEEACSN
jgi:hypothetical protein